MRTTHLLPLAVGALLLAGCSGADTATPPPSPTPSRDAVESLAECPDAEGQPLVPSATDLASMDVRELVACRWTSPSTGDPNADAYTFEAAARATGASAVEIARELAAGTPVGAGRCSMIDSPPPVRDDLRITDDDGTVWSVVVVQPDCLGYDLDGSRPLQALGVSGMIGAVLDPSGS